MGLFGKLFGSDKSRTYRWKPLLCHAGDVIDLMRELERIDAPILDLEFEYAGQRHHCGMSAELEPESREPENVLWFLDEQEFTSLEAFLDGAEVEGKRFAEIDAPIGLLHEEDTGDPRGYTLLAGREMPAADTPFS